MSIWDYKSIKEASNVDNFITLGEGDTPLQKITDNLWLKREDLNPTGSWKDRSTAFKITKLYAEGVREAVIASSGNAAVSFMSYANITSNFKIHAVVSSKINPEKLLRLQKANSSKQHRITFSDSAKAQASKISGREGIHLLKSSIDKDLTIGYWSLGYELASKIRHSKKAVWVILPVSSGAALVGMAEGLFAKLGTFATMPRLVACQTQSCHPLVEEQLKDESQSLADAIVDKSMLRKPQVLKAVNETSGKVFAISNAEINTASALCKEKVSDLIGNTSLLTIAGYLRLIKSYPKDEFICITSGI